MQPVRVPIERKRRRKWPLLAPGWVKHLHITSGFPSSGAFAGIYRSDSSAVSASAHCTLTKLVRVCTAGLVAVGVPGIPQGPRPFTSPLPFTSTQIHTE